MVSLRALRKTYRRGQEEISVLNGIDLDIAEGAFEALMGPSGSGKTTLLNLIAGIDRPSAGTIHVAGTDISKQSEGELADWRAQHVGYIFQFYNLLPVLTAAENVEIPLLLAKLSKSERQGRVRTALRVVGLDDRMNHYPRQLSGGQEQRVAIARAFVSDPTLLIADEPTGDLDRKSGDEVLELLATLNREFGKTIVMVTHDPHAAERASVVRRLEKGVLVPA
jgi:putative ABC transport system ATP-binding protein